MISSPLDNLILSPIWLNSPSKKNKYELLYHHTGLTDKAYISNTSLYSIAVIVPLSSQSSNDLEKSGNWNSGHDVSNKVSLSNAKNLLL